MNKFSFSYLFRFTISMVQLDSPVPRPEPSYDSPFQRFLLLEILETGPVLEIPPFRDSLF